MNYKPGNKVYVEGTYIKNVNTPDSPHMIGFDGGYVFFNEKNLIPVDNVTIKDKPLHDQVVQHWENIKMVAESDERDKYIKLQELIQPEYCAYCDKYGDNCLDCPVYKYTGGLDCINTPYRKIHLLTQELQELAYENAYIDRHRTATKHEMLMDYINQMFELLKRC